MRFFRDRLFLWKITLWLVLIYSLQHLVRDVLSDVFNIRNAFTEFGHRVASEADWCGRYCKWTTFPIEIFYIVSSVYLLKKKEFGLLGWLMVFMAIPVLLQYLDILVK